MTHRWFRVADRIVQTWMGAQKIPVHQCMNCGRRVETLTPSQTETCKRTGKFGR